MVQKYRNIMLKCKWKYIELVQINLKKISDIVLFKNLEKRDSDVLLLALEGE